MNTIDTFAFKAAMQLWSFWLVYLASSLVLTAVVVAAIVRGTRR